MEIKSIRSKRRDTVTLNRTYPSANFHTVLKNTPTSTAILKILRHMKIQEEGRDQKLSLDRPRSWNDESTLCRLG